MGQVDEGLNPPGAEGEPESKEGRFVSVQEAIRYRKRAQGAEKRSEELAAELVEAKGQVDKLCEELGAVKIEQKLMRKLTAAGAADLEAGVLLVKSRVNDGDGSTTLTTSSDEVIDRAIEQLKKDKQYLFSDKPGSKLPGSTGRSGFGTAGTAGAKQSRLVGSGSGVVLERAARKAAETGDRKDLQEYLRVRRNYL
jgi:hypothetical protein